MPAVPRPKPRPAQHADTVKVTKPKGAPLPPAPLPGARMVDPLDLAADIGMLAKELKEAASSGKTLSQSSLRTAWALKAIKSLAESATKLFDEAVKPWDGKLSEAFEPGELVIQIDNNPKRSPSWKDEAIKQAGKVAELQAVPFIEAVYIARVQDATPLADSKSVKIVEVTG